MTISPGVAQVLLARLVFNLPPDKAVAAPRFMFPTDGASIAVDPSMTQDVKTGLEKRGGKGHRAEVARLRRAGHLLRRRQEDPRVGSAQARQRASGVNAGSTGRRPPQKTEPEARAAVRTYAEHREAGSARARRSARSGSVSSLKLARHVRWFDGEDRRSRWLGEERRRPLGRRAPRAASSARARSQRTLRFRLELEARAARSMVRWRRPRVRWLGEERRRPLGRRARAASSARARSQRTLRFRLELEARAARSRWFDGQDRGSSLGEERRRPLGRRAPRAASSARARSQRTIERGKTRLTGPQVLVGGPYGLARRRPTLPHGYPCSTIGSEELNFRVRDGIGCGLFEIATGNLWGVQEHALAQ